MDHDLLRNRTKNFALRVIRLVNALPRKTASDVLGRQVLRSATSIGANYRESRRASSTRHFVSLMEIVLREADETNFWLELIEEAKLVKASLLGPLRRESDELVAIFAASVKTAKKRRS